MTEHPADNATPTSEPTAPPEPTARQRLGYVLGRTLPAELHDWVVKLCEARGVRVPHSSWTRVKLELARTVGKRPQIIHRDTLIVRDLGFS